MASNDPWRRYLETGAAFVNLTRSRAESIVRDLVRQGELGQERAQKAVDELLERSRRNTDDLVKIIRREIRQQLEALGVTAGRTRSGSGAKKSTAKKAAAKTSTTKKSATKKAATKKSTAKKAAAKKAAGSSPGQGGAASSGPGPVPA